MIAAVLSRAEHAVDVVAEENTETVGAGRSPDLGDSFPEQWAYVTSTELFNAVCCSRRAGKSTGAVWRAIWLMTTRPGARVHYVSLIRRNAKKHFWRPLLRTLKELGWSYRPNESDMILELPNGSWCQALSCPDHAAIKSVKGDWTDLFMVDECQEPNNDVLEALIDVAAMPMLTDKGGMLDLLGVAPEVEPCFFSDALDSDGWAHFSWTQFQHDFPVRRETKWERVQKACERRALPLNVQASNDNDGRLVLVPLEGTHPIVLREYFGKRAKDPSKLAYEYQPGRNDYDPAAVDFDKPTVRHSAGLDLASVTDNDAIVVHAWFTDDGERIAYTRFAWQWNGLHVDDLALVVALVHRVYRARWVGDTGGHGAQKVLATLAARLKMLFAPKPTDVLVSVRLINDDYRAARLKHPTSDVETAKVLAAVDGMPWTDEQKNRARELLSAGAAPLVREVAGVSKTINVRTRKVEINKKGLHSDLSEANRYASHGSRNWAAKAPPPEPTDPDEIVWERRRREEKLRAQQTKHRFPWTRRRSAG